MVRVLDHALGDGPEEDLLAPIAGDVAQRIFDTFLFPGDDVDDRIAGADQGFEFDVHCGRGQVQIPPAKMLRLESVSDMRRPPVSTAQKKRAAKGDLTGVILL